MFFVEYAGQLYQKWKFKMAATAGQIHKSTILGKYFVWDADPYEGPSHVGCRLM